MDHVVGVEGSHHVTDGVDVTDIGQEAVAQALSLAGAPDQTGNIDEGDRRRDGPLRSEDRGQVLDPGVGNGNHTGIGLDGGKGVVRRQHPGVGECVEQGGLADVGKSHDPDRETHGRCRLGRATRQQTTSVP